MTHAQIIEGTTEEIARQLQQSYAGQKLRIFVEPEDEEDLAAGLPDPPFAVRSRDHLIELLREGMNSPTHPVTEQTWEPIRQEVRRRHQA